MGLPGSDMNIDPLLWRLAETIAWCTQHGVLAEPSVAAYKLRTPELCPPGHSYVRDEHGYTTLEPSIGSLRPDVLTMLVDEVAQLRAAHLRATGLYPLTPASHLARGRLLCYALHENLAEGVEEQETKGYFDVQAVPPWDTWLLFTTQQTRLKNHFGQEFWHESYLISWVPPELIRVVDEGAVQTSTTHALEWADKMTSELFVCLRAVSIRAE
jgi:hypothetical protein